MTKSVMPWCFSLLAGVLMFGGMLVCDQPEASGRPKYSKGFFEAYPENKAAAALEGNAKCSVCHPGTDKKTRNDYGSALGKAIGKKNEMEETKIKDALKKIEGEASGTAGKTFGDLLKDGKLPGK